MNIFDRAYNDAVLVLAKVRFHVGFFSCWIFYNTMDDRKKKRTWKKKIRHLLYAQGQH